MSTGQIRSFILWLHRSDHVARFQNYFGILPVQNQFKQNSYERNHKRKVTYDTNVIDECLDEIKHSRDQQKSSDVDYQVTNWFWYYFFQFGSALGNEIFYIVFFPTWFVICFSID